MKILNIILLTLSLIVAFFISTTALVMGDSFLILRDGREILASVLCAVFFSCLFVFPIFGIMKLALMKHAENFLVFWGRFAPGRAVAGLVSEQCLSGRKC